MQRARRWFGPQLIEFSDRTLRANRRRVEIQYARRERRRKKAYLDLLRVSREVCAMASVVRSVMRDVLEGFEPEELRPQMKIVEQLGHYVHQTERVIDQTRRRVVAEEDVPRSEGHAFYRKLNELFRGCRVL